MYKSRKVAAIAAISSALECYDFVIYAALIPYLNVNFFSNVSQELGIFYSLMIFAVGYVSRPVGGLIFGTMGDKYGRKKTFTLSLFLMALSTVMIAILPTTNQVGVVATILLVLCRYVQGLSQGGEVPGAITFVVEHVKSAGINTNCALIYLGLGFGALLSSLVCYTLTSVLSEASMIEWGWRIPFIFGGALALLSFYIRRKMYESPHFNALPKLEGSQKPILYILKNHRKELAKGISFVVLAASMVTFTLTYPAYMSGFTMMSPTQSYLIMCLGMLIMAISAPMFGKLSDTYGPEKVFKVVTCTAISSSPFIFDLVSTHNVVANGIVMALVQIMIGGLLGSFPVRLANNFPSKVRYTGIAVTYNLAFAMSAFVPALLNALLTQFQSHYVVGFLFSGIGIFSLVLGMGGHFSRSFLFEEKTTLSLNN